MTADITITTQYSTTLYCLLHTPRSQGSVSFKPIQQIQAPVVCMKYHMLTVIYGGPDSGTGSTLAIKTKKMRKNCRRWAHPNKKNSVLLRKNETPRCLFHIDHLHFCPSNKRFGSFVLFLAGWLFFIVRLYCTVNGQNLHSCAMTMHILCLQIIFPAFIRYSWL